MRIAHANALPPFTMVENGTSSGMVLEICRASVESAGHDAVFVPVPFEEMQSALIDGRADAAIPVAITPERRERLDFSAPLLMTGGSLYVRAPAATPPGLQALAGKTVVTPGDGPLAAFITRTAPQVNLVVTRDYQSSLAQLVNGEADAAALNHQAGALLAAQLYPGRITRPDAMLIELPFGAAFAKGRNDALRAAVDSGLATIRADGTYERIIERWMGR